MKIQFASFNTLVLIQFNTLSCSSFLEADLFSRKSLFRQILFSTTIMAMQKWNPGPYLF